MQTRWKEDVQAETQARRMPGSLADIHGRRNATGRNRDIIQNNTYVKLKLR